LVLIESINIAGILVCAILILVEMGLVYPSHLYLGECLMWMNSRIKQTMLKVKCEHNQRRLRIDPSLFE